MTKCNSHSRTSPIVHCGPLARDAAGNWWFDAMFLGSDNAPSAGLVELETTAAFVAIRMMEALEGTLTALERAGDEKAIAEATRHMTGFLAWWNSGQWGGPPLPPTSFLTRLELMELVHKAKVSTTRLLDLFRDEKIRSAMSEIEAWHGRATRLLHHESTNR